MITTLLQNLFKNSFKTKDKLKIMSLKLQKKIKKFKI
jgi:hypothetical protein